MAGDELETDLGTGLKLPGARGGGREGCVGCIVIGPLGICHIFLEEGALLVCFRIPGRGAQAIDSGSGSAHMLGLNVATGSQRMRNNDGMLRRVRVDVARVALKRETRYLEATHLTYDTNR